MIPGALVTGGHRISCTLKAMLETRKDESPSNPQAHRTNLHPDDGSANFLDGAAGRRQVDL